MKLTWIDLKSIWLSKYPWLAVLDWMPFQSCFLSILICKISFGNRKWHTLKDFEKELFVFLYRIINSHTLIINHKCYMSRAHVLSSHNFGNSCVRGWKSWTFHKVSLNYRFSCANARACAQTAIIQRYFMKTLPNLEW